jgi:hypothetical protein
VVGASTGRLYVPFLHFSDADADNVRVLVSDDGGNTFHFLEFNMAGAVDKFAFPNVTPGIVNDCRGGGRRNVLFAGANQGGGRGGLPEYRQTTRLVSQPAAAAGRGAFLFAINSSTSPIFGDPTAGSEIRLVYSPDGGRSWATSKVVGSTSADPQHVHPAVSLSRDGERLDVSYYVQQADQRLRTDVATLTIDDRRVRLSKTAPLSSTAFDLTPNNIKRTPIATTNFDRTVTTCYNIGEYQTLARSGGDDDDSVTAAWGDNRNTWPPNPPLAGSSAPNAHSQPDVFAGKAGGDD